MARFAILKKTKNLTILFIVARASRLCLRSGKKQTTNEPTKNNLSNSQCHRNCSTFRINRCNCGLFPRMRLSSRNPKLTCFTHPKFNPERTSKAGKFGLIHSQNTTLLCPYKIRNYDRSSFTPFYQEKAIAFLE